VAGVPSPPLPGGSEIETLRATVAQYFPVYETRVTPMSLVLLVHAEPSTLEKQFDGLRQELWTKQYVPQIRYEGGEYVVEVVRRPPRRPWGPWANLILLGLTIVTTVSAGAFLWLSYRGGSQLSAQDVLFGGLYFGLPLLAILGVHELAHFVMARRHHVEASLPYFLPVPPPFVLFGTFGAFISLREPIPDKKALLDIGAAGPIAGFAMAIPITLAGMFLSAHAPVLPPTNCGPSFLGVNYGNVLIGLSPLWLGLSKLVPVTFVNLHPLALAGWVGLLVTAINLLPAGQLDGGHVFRALLGDRSRYLSYGAALGLFALGILYQGWIIFAILIFVLGLRHPPPLNDITRLDAKRWAIGAFAAAILITGFVVVPISSPDGAYGVPVHSATTIAKPPGAAMADTITVTVANHDAIVHGFLFSATVRQVVGTNLTVLTGSALLAFERNATWQLRLPNGSTTTLSGLGNWSLSSSQYSQIDAGASGTLLATFTDTERALVSVDLTISEVCSGPSGGPQTYGFTLQ
jgi:Zn-dependent protease